jgi:hypothetical protein
MNDIKDLTVKPAPPLPEGTFEHIALLCEAFDFAQFSTIDQLNQLPKPVFYALHTLLADTYAAAYGPKKICKTCKYWGTGDRSTEPPRGPANLKYCNSEKLDENGYQKASDITDDMLLYDYTEGGGFGTGPDFGCVHWAANDSN